MGLGRLRASRRHVDAARPKLGLPFAPPGVAKGGVGERTARTLGMARRLGRRRYLGTSGSELGLPLAVASANRSRCASDRETDQQTADGSRGQRNSARLRAGRRIQSRFSHITGPIGTWGFFGLLGTRAIRACSPAEHRQGKA